MKVFFFCGSLEPGKDGVGDYTRRLAAALIGLGHEATIVSLYDSNIAIVRENQHQDGQEISVLRLEKNMPWEQKKSALLQRIKEFKPDWASLQYVPYSFNDKGCPILLGRRLSKLGNTVKWHVMIHEPFLGKTHSFKEKAVQYLQILAVKQLYSKLKPLSVHTSLSHYKGMLKQYAGKEVKLLELFGNVPIAASYKKETALGPPHSYKAVYFGTAPKTADWSSIADKLSTFTQDNIEVELYVAGRLGPLGESFCAFLKEKAFAGSAEKNLHVLGGVAMEELSRLFSGCDFGVSRVPARLIGKSGTAISMLEHGLPLWIPVLEGDDEKFLHFGKDLCFFNLSDLKTLNIHKPEYGSRLNIIANHFLNDLQQSAGKK